MRHVNVRAVWTAMIFISPLMFVASALAQPLTISSGPDLFVTQAGSPPSMGTFADLPFPLPPGFFGTKMGIPSDPIPGGSRLFFGGQPTGDMGQMPTVFSPCGPFDELGMLAKHGLLGDARMNGGVAMTDTIVRRNASANLPMLGSMDTIPIEIISLSLTSVMPIMVTYGAQPASFFDVFVHLDPNPQPVGSMTLTRTMPNGGTFDAVLPVNAVIRFVNTDPMGPQAQQPLPFQDTLHSANVCWLVPEPLCLSWVSLVALCLWRKRRP